MNLLFYFGGFSTLGGIETFARNLLLDQIQRGRECSLVCWGKESDLLKQMKYKGVRILRIGWRWGCRWNIPDWLLLPAGIMEVRHAHIVLFGKLLPGKQLKMLRRTAGSNIRFIFITPYRPVVALHPDDRRKARDQFDCFDEIWVQDEQFKKDLREIGYTKKMAVIPYMPEPTLPPESFRPEPLCIGFLGRLVDDKNLPLLFRAFQLIYSKAEFSVQLDIYGDGPLREQLESFAETLKIGNRVHFHGAIPQSKVRSAINNCHLFAFTSHAEGQCLAALEILGAGRPVVATDAGAFPDILKDKRLGELVIEKTPESVAGAILRMMDAIRHQKITPQIVHLAYTERFGAEEIGERYSTLIQSVIDQNHAFEY